jgi:hypothetical protein
LLWCLRSDFAIKNQVKQAGPVFVLAAQYHSQLAMPPNAAKELRNYEDACFFLADLAYSIEPNTLFLFLRAC